MLWVAFLELLHMKIVCLICSSAQIIIHILEPEEVEWQFTERKALIVPFTISRIHLSVQNLKKMYMR